MLRSKIKNLLHRNERLYENLKIFYFKLTSLLMIIDDKNYLIVQYFLRVRKCLNLENPKLFNEKIQWLKLYYRNPILNTCVDKWEVRKYISDKGFADILIPAIGPFDSLSKIDIKTLPKSFIVKLTNGSGLNEIVFDRDHLCMEKISAKFEKWKKVDFYSARREWAYKNVPNRILCETLLCNESHSLPSDIRFFCFHGEVKFIAIDLESVVDGKKTSNYYRHLFTVDWDEMDSTIQYPKKAGFVPCRPKKLDDMIKISESLSRDFPFVRVDLYDFNDKIYFGELTFYHASGYQKISPMSFELQMGIWLDLDRINNPI